MQELTDDGGSGDAQVDEAVRTLEALEGLPVHEHAPVVERVHQVLQDRLSGEPDAVADDDFGDDGHGAADSPSDAAEPGARPAAGAVRTTDGSPTPGAGAVAGGSATPGAGAVAGGSATPGAGSAAGGSPRPGAGPTPGGWLVSGGTSKPGAASAPGEDTGSAGSGDGEG